MADNSEIEDHDGGGSNASLPENGPSNTGSTTQCNMLKQFHQHQNYLMILYSQKISLLPQLNTNEFSTNENVDTDNYVDP